MREFIFDSVDTTRFRLRVLEAEPYQEFLKLATDEEMLYYIGIPSAEVAEEKAKAKYGLRTYNKSYLMFLIVDISSDKVIGHCGFHTWYLDHARAEIGYALYADEWKGRGVMSEVLNTVLDYGFNTMGLTRVEAFVGPDNIASLKTAEKMGFVKEGQLRDHYIHNGAVEDSVVFGLLASEFNPLDGND